MCFPRPLPADQLQSPETPFPNSWSDPPIPGPSSGMVDSLPVGASEVSSMASVQTLNRSDPAGSLSSGADVNNSTFEQGVPGEMEVGFEKELDQGREKVLEGDVNEKVLEEEYQASSSCSLLPSRNYGKCSPPPAPTSPRFGSTFDELRFHSSPFDFDGDQTGCVSYGPRLPPPPPPSPPPVGAGLANLGNTCFLNAVMQCFTHTVPFVQGLHLPRDDENPCHHGNEEFCVLSAVRDHIFRALAASGKVIYPDNLVNDLSYISSLFQRYRQEDAHEYLQCLLDKIDSCSSKCKVDDDKDVSSKGGGLVQNVFGGRLLSQLHCCKCGHQSNTYEPLVDLSLEIENADNLDGALESFTKMESIEDEEVKFTCENCKEQVPVKKQLKLDQAPSVAVLHLKRFKSDGHFVEKIDKALDYPLELDLKPYTVNIEDENVDLKYELYAVVVHVGFSSTSGHYFCYIRSSPDKWFRIDDSKVSMVQEEVALSQQGYILFYAKKGTPWPCSLVKASSEYDIWNTSPKSVLDNVEPMHSSNSLRPPLCNETPVESRCINRGTPSPSQLAFPELCSTPPSRDINGTTPNEPSSSPRRDVCNIEPVDLDSIFLSAKPEVNEVKGSSNVNAQCSGLGGINAESCFPSAKENVEPVTKSSVGSGSCHKLSKSRSLSPDIYCEPEEHQDLVPSQHPKKLKKEHKVTPAKGNKMDVEHDRKTREAMRSLRGTPRGRRGMLMAAINETRSKGSASEKRARVF